MKSSQIPKILVIVGTTRQGRFSEKAASYILREASKLKEIEVELVDLRDYPLPFFDESVPPSMLEAAKHEYQNDIVRKWTRKIDEADGFIIITAEYNHGYPAVLKNALDYVFKGWNKKPVGFVGYGSTGASRAIEQLKEVAIELQMVPIRNAIHIPFQVYMAVMNEKLPVDPELFKPLREGYKDHVATFFDELVWATHALKSARDMQVS